MKVRQPSSAGLFYERSKENLKRQLEKSFFHEFGPRKFPNVMENNQRKILSMICPHAGYIFSGPIAANAYYQSSLDGRPNSVVILGPNHTGMGSGISTMIEGFWRTPLGDVEIDMDLAKNIQKNSNYIDIEDKSHIYEHSIEVQLPFLQFTYGESFKFVPICMMMQDFEVSKDVGEAIAKAAIGKNIQLIASTDLTHYENKTSAESKDQDIINAIINLDEKLLFSVVESKSISMCGYGPVSSVIVASKRLGAKNVKLLSYRTSGDITGDYTQVVGYASLIISK